MICNNCGFQNNPGDMFCKQCGTQLNSVPVQQNINPQMAQPQMSVNPQPVINPQMTQPQMSVNPQPVINPQMVQPQMSVNPQPTINLQMAQPQMNNYPNSNSTSNATLWAVLSVVLPTASILFYWFIGLTVYVALGLAGIGFYFAKRGKDNKVLSTIGKVLSGILAGLAIMMFILGLIEHFS